MTEISHILRYLSDLELIRTRAIRTVWERTNSHKMEIFCGKPYRSHTIYIPILWALNKKNLLNLKTHTIPRCGKLVPIDFPMYENIFSQFTENRWEYLYLSHSWILRDFSCACPDLFNNLTRFYFKTFAYVDW